MLLYNSMTLTKMEAHRQWWKIKSFVSPVVDAFKRIHSVHLWFCTQWLKPFVAWREKSFYLMGKISMKNSFHLKSISQRDSRQLNVNNLTNILSCDDGSASSRLESKMMFTLCTDKSWGLLWEATQLVMVYYYLRIEAVRRSLAWNIIHDVWGLPH